jgi:hypothetical protein
MVGLLIFVAVIGLLVIAPLVLCVWRERLQDRGLAIQADIDAALRRRLHGESLLGVHVVAEAPWRPGRVELSLPTQWDPVLAQVSPAVLARVPSGYDLVVHRFGPPALRAAA